MATSATELGNEPAVEMPKTDSEAKLPRDFPDLADDAEEEIVVGWLTKRVVRAPCCFLWAILAFVIFITLAVVAVEVAPARGFLDVFAVPWFNPKYEVVVLRGLGVDLLYEDKLVSTEDTTDEDKDQEREFTLYPVTIAYEDIATDNLITSANIAKIIEVEKSLLSIDWKDRCVLAYLDEDQKPKDAYCRSPTTLLNYLHVNNDKHQDLCNDGYCYMPDSIRSYCSGVNSTGFSWGTYPCTSYVYDWRDGELADEKDWRDLLNDNLCKAGFVTKVVLDKANEDCKDEDPIVTKYSRSTYAIGWPLQGYSDRDDRRGEQTNKLVGGIFGSGTYGPALLASISAPILKYSATSLNSQRYVNRTSGDKTINVLMSEGVTGREADTQFQAVFLSILSLVFVFLYIWFNVGSLFLAVTGTFEIVASLPLAWFVWRIIMWQVRLDVFAFSLIIFLILCIGADDIFVFIDTWKSSATKPAHISGSIETRLQWTYVHAASAMFTTTATTVLALVMTATSTIPFIQSFGIFAFLVVIMDYLLVITWFPVTVIVYEKYFVSGCCAKWCACLPSCKIKKTDPSKPVPTRRSVVFIRDKVAPVFFKYRLYLFTMTSLLVIAMCVVLGSLYKVGEDFPDFYVPTHPFYAMNEIQREKFFTADDWRHSVMIVYGSKPDAPVNRSLNGQLTLDIQNDEDLVGNYVPFNFDVRMQESLVKDCDDLKKDASLVYKKQAYCMLNNIRNWRPDDFPYEGTKELRVAIDEFLKSDTYAAKIVAETLYERNTGFSPDGDDGIKNYWVTYNATIPKEASSGPNSLKSWQIKWEAVADTECAAPCYPHMINPPTSSPISWEFMTIIEILEETVWSTMMLSVLCAWVVLVFVTRNWWISTMVAFIIVCIMVCVIATVFCIGYVMDIFVSTFVALTIGLAIDYSVHIAHFYVHSKGNRFERTQVNQNTQNSKE